MKVWIAIVGLLFSFSSVADQCSYVTKEQAQKALKILSDQNKAYDFCEPCRDERPKAVEVDSIGYERIESEFVDDIYYQLKVNGKGRDLAYLYDSRKINLAVLVGCDVSDIQPLLFAIEQRVDDEEDHIEAPKPPKVRYNFRDQGSGSQMYD